MLRRTPLLLLVVAVGSCAPPAGTRPPPSARRPFQAQPIVNGAVQSSSTYETVGMLSAAPTGSNYGTACTGTLIARNVVLTAGHCAFDEPSGSGPPPFIDVGNGWDAYFIMAADANDGPFDSFVKVRRYIPHPSFDYSSLQNDIALVILERDVSGDGPGFTIWPYEQTHDTDLDNGGINLLFVGYGITQAGGSDSGIRRSVSIPVADYYDQNSPCWAAQYQQAPQFCYSDGTHGTCQGDSGGPALKSIGGRQTIVGLTSFGDGSCVDWGVDTRVDYYANWIQQTASANAGQAESCGNGSDDDGDGLADCRDPDCEGSPKCPNGITQPAGACAACSNTVPCASGLICVKSSAGASSGKCQAPCTDTCSGGGTCATFLDESQACTCSGQSVVDDGQSCSFGRYCAVGSLCANGTCQRRCDSGFTCPAGDTCDASSHLCVSSEPATSSSGSGGTTGGDSGSGTTTGESGDTGATSAAGTTGGDGTAGGTTGSTGVTAEGHGCTSAEGLGLLPLLALGLLRRRRP